MSFPAPISTPWPEDESRWQVAEPAPPAIRIPNLWPHIVLLALTLFSTTLVGTHMYYNFVRNLPYFSAEDGFDIFLLGLKHPHLLWTGLPFSLTLLLILMAHELGHYLTCLYYGVDATPPYFLPAPTPFTGTLGAFIRIKSPVCSKKILFDIGIAGPLAGFVFVIPALAIGLAFSKIVPGLNAQSEVQLGVPVLQRLLEMAVFPGVASGEIYLHPVARAAWVGMFATALNLLPVGQLDGGHIVYALFGRWHKWVTYGFLGLLLPMGLLWKGWWLWAVLLFLFARKHPMVFDDSKLGVGRWQLGLTALLVFLLCFSLVPLNV